MVAEAVSVAAPAKLNLALSVGPRQEDGRHPICSWMVSIDLSDELLVTRLPPDRLSRYAILWHEGARCCSDIDWSISRDLAVRAHLALEEHVGRPLPVQLKLEKRIPVGGGLGGGSSDAAAMLRAVDDLFDLDLGLARLAEIGARLGSDVPFLVHGGSAVVEGVGERLLRHEAVAEMHFALVFPGPPCPTARVYERFDELPGPRLEPEAVHGLVGSSLTGAAGHPVAARPPRPDALFNDLTPAAIRVAPVLGDHLKQLTELAERPAHLSGSGSTVFVLCDDPLHAEHLAAAFERRHGRPAVAARACPGAPVVRGLG